MLGILETKFELAYNLSFATSTGQFLLVCSWRDLTKLSVPGDVPKRSVQLLRLGVRWVVKYLFPDPTAIFPKTQAATTENPIN